MDSERVMLITQSDFDQLDRGVDLCDVIRDGGTLGSVTTGAAVAHAVAMSVQREFDEARRRQAMRRTNPAVLFAAAMGVDILSALPSPPKPRELTDFDRQQIAAAEAKRERKRAKYAL